MLLPETKVIILDDDIDRQTLLCALLEFINVKCQAFSFVNWLQQSRSYNLAFVDLVMIGYSQLPIDLFKLAQNLTDQHALIPKVLLCEWPEVDALKAEQVNIIGDFLPPYQHAVLLKLLHLAYRKHYQKTLVLEKPIHCPGFIGENPKIQAIRKIIQQVAPRDVTVLITGDSGTGKELVARALHQNSPRHDKPFVPLNCGAIPADLLESELFGHEKGAFTGAVSSRAGRFELADGGTLFLDEIGDMPLPMQVKLLRVLQERQFERVGGTKTLEVDVRIITATHKNLESMINAEQFREDLYYRLNVFPIEMPPLRERLDDLELLIEELFKRLNPEEFLEMHFLPETLESLRLHAWQGNVRELSNLIERLSITHSGGVISVSDLPPRFQHVEEPYPEHYQQDVPESESSKAHSFSAQGARLDILKPDFNAQFDLKAYLEETEKKLLESALEDAQQIVAKAARTLGIRRTTLVEKMRKYGMARP